MTVSQLKAMCSKFFKVEMLKVKMTYVEESTQYELDDDFRLLTFYSVSDGGRIIVDEI